MHCRKAGLGDRLRVSRCFASRGRLAPESRRAASPMLGAGRLRWRVADPPAARSDTCRPTSRAENRRAAASRADRTDRLRPGQGRPHPAVDADLGGASVVGVSMRNAAELALTEAGGNDLTLLVKDDRSTPDGAATATQEALAERRRSHHRAAVRPERARGRRASPMAPASRSSPSRPTPRRPATASICLSFLAEILCRPHRRFRRLQRQEIGRRADSGQ